MKRIFLVILTILILSILIILVVFYFFKIKIAGNRNQITSNNRQVEKSEISSFGTTAGIVPADWLLYQNDKYSYSIRYPGGWCFEESSKEFIFITSYSCDIPGRGGPPPKKEIQIVIYIFPNGKNLAGELLSDLDDWAEKISFIEKQEITIDSERAIRGKVQDVLTGEFKGDIRIIKNNTGYQIGYSPYDSDLTEIFNDILSTFKFTD